MSNNGLSLFKSTLCAGTPRLYKPQPVQAWPCPGNKFLTLLLKVLLENQQQIKFWDGGTQFVLVAWRHWMSYIQTKKDGRPKDRNGYIFFLTCQDFPNWHRPCLNYKWKTKVKVFKSAMLKLAILSSTYPAISNCAKFKTWSISFPFFLGGGAWWYRNCRLGS